MTRSDPNDNSNNQTSQTNKSALDFKQRLFLWYETLIASIESYLPKDPQQTITIIPDGFLAQIPQPAIVTGAHCR